MEPREGISHDYCAVRSGSLERVQKMAERRMDGHGKKIDDLTRASLQLTAAVERVSLILEKQDKRLDRVEDRGILAFLKTEGGKALARWLGITLLAILAAAIGINLTEVFSL